MSPILVSPEELKRPTTWAVNGQSPANSPMAILQAAAQAMEMAQDPETGLDKYEIAKRILAAGPLANANLQLSKDDLATKLAPPVQPPPILGLPGMAGVPGLPVLPPGVGGPPMPNGGPDQGPVLPA